MRPEVARAERALEVRRAARAWRRAGTIDDAALGAIDAAHGDDRVRARGAFRVLFFVFTAFAMFAAFGLLLAIGFDGSKTFGIAAFFFAALGVVLTEIQTGRMRRDRAGTEEATAFTAVIFLMTGALWFVFEILHVESSRAELSLVLALFIVILAAATWRWAHLAAAVAAAVCAFWLLARAPYGRWLWVIAAGLSIVPLLRASVSGRLAPSRRRACVGVLGVALAAFYIAVSVWSFDRWIVERIGDRVPDVWRILSLWEAPAVTAVGPAWSILRAVHVVLTALVPLALIAAGLRTRRRILLDAGLVFTVLSLATIRAYWHVAALWIVLVVAGAALIAVAMALHRRLDRTPGKELRGITAEPLFANPAHAHALKVAVAVAAWSPAARQLPSEEPGVQGHGGASGGGGAGGEI